MKSIYLEVQVEPGSDEVATAQDMVILSKQLGVTLQGRHNGTLMIARPHQNVSEVLEEFENMKRWMEALDRRNTATVREAFYTNSRKR